MGAQLSFPIVALPRERVVVVTGGNAGIGYETAKHIAMMGATVIIACRSEQRAQGAIKRMNEEFQEEKKNGREGIIQDDKLPVEYMNLDLASLKSTMDFITAFKSSGRPLHCLLCNAGIALVPREYTMDGYESMFQVNYLSHFLIVAHLLPIIKRSGDDCRITFTSSRCYNAAKFDLTKAQATDPKDYGRLRHYGNSKLYQIQHMFCLSRRLQKTSISVTSLHPGLVDTEIGKYSEDMWGMNLINRAYRFTGFMKTPLQGATTLIDAAVNPKWKGVSNVYLDDCKEHSMTADARNKEYQEALWKYSLDCLKDYLPDDVIHDLEGKQ